MKRLTQKFFDRPTLKVAQELIGCHLTRRLNGKIIRYVITETEAYDGPNDLASHASKGKTSRNEIMFGPAGYFYVYLVYGMHWILNIVTESKGYPSAILIRGIDTAKGPAKLTKKLKITGDLNKKTVSVKSGLWVEERKRLITPGMIEKLPRVGIDYAGPIWKKKKWRFVLIYPC